MLRIGVAGAGNIASIAQLPTLVARDDVELQGLVTRKDDPQPLMRRWGFRRAYPTVEALLETEELDALFVLTPRSEHVHATRLALEAGVDVFCEKPLATSASDALSLAELAAARERVLMVGFNRRFAPVYETGRAAFGESGASFCVAQKNRAGSEYRATFDSVAAACPDARFAWIDIEDEADIVDPVEVENFPTLLIAARGEPVFFSPLTPHRETLVRLVRSHAEGDAHPLLAAEDLRALVTRLQSVL